MGRGKHHFLHFIHFTHLISFVNFIHKGKGEVPPPKKKKEKGRSSDLGSSSTRQPDHAHASTHERNETKTIPGWSPPPTQKNSPILLDVAYIVRSLFGPQKANFESCKNNKKRSCHEQAISSRAKSDR